MKLLTKTLGAAALFFAVTLPAAAQQSDIVLNFDDDGFPVCYTEIAVYRLIEASKTPAPAMGATLDELVGLGVCRRLDREQQLQVLLIDGPVTMVSYFRNGQLLNGNIPTEWWKPYYDDLVAGR